ncbi:hypothetical protein TTRE_0000802401 [Trichuris trichiura]|uniref:DUF7083 domain-containing protein n=1 Tax=Trichuris trichiura TaxID=36087 RepID=A0A077ZHB5_TRITR|nr:hypothetical protein TTRE_0000802401 [Trichuris trichiura]
MDTLAASISEFDYDPSTEDTFEAWFSRYEDFFNIEAAELDDAARVRLLLRKLWTNVHKKYADYILPRHPRDVCFDETVNILTKMFGHQRSLFNARYRCFFKLTKRSPNDAAVRLKLLNKIETEPNVTIAKLVDECNHLRNLKYDTEMVQQSAGSDPLEVDKVAAKRNSRSTFTQCDRSPHKQPARKPKTPCWLCGAWHYTRFCPYKSHVCTRCGDMGQKGFCPPAKTLPSPKRKVSLRKKFQHRGAKTTPRVSSTYELSSVSSNVYTRHISVNIEKKVVTFQTDTGSDDHLCPDLEATWLTATY